MTAFDWFLLAFGWCSVGHVILCRDISRYIYLRNPDFVPDVTLKFVSAWLFVACAWPYWIGRDR